MTPTGRNPVAQGGLYPNVNIMQGCGEEEEGRGHFQSLHDVVFQRTVIAYKCNLASRGMLSVTYEPKRDLCFQNNACW